MGAGMSGLTVHGRRLVLELNRAIGDGDTPRAVELVDSWGLHRAERLAVCRELAKPDAERVEFVYGKNDQAHVRTVSDVWNDRATA